MLSIDFKKTNKFQDNSLTQETKYKRRRTICKIEKKKRRLNIRRNSDTLKTDKNVGILFKRKLYVYTMNALKP